MESRVKDGRASTLVVVDREYASAQKVEVDDKLIAEVKKRKARKDKEKAKEAEEELSDVQRALGIVQQIIEKSKSHPA